MICFSSSECVISLFTVICRLLPLFYVQMNDCSKFISLIFIVLFSIYFVNFFVDILFRFIQLTKIIREWYKITVSPLDDCSHRKALVEWQWFQRCKNHLYLHFDLKVCARLTADFPSVFLMHFATKYIDALSLCLTWTNCLCR